MFYIKCKIRYNIYDTTYGSTLYLSYFSLNDVGFVILMYYSSLLPRCLLS